MREKKWVDCPICGQQGSMEYRVGVTERREPQGYPPFEIPGLDGYFCKECGEGFWTRASEERIAAASAEHKARGEG